MYEYSFLNYSTLVPNVGFSDAPICTHNYGILITIVTVSEWVSPFINVSIISRTHLTTLLIVYIGLNL